MELGGGWNELGRGGWSWVEVGARFSNTLSEKNYKKQAQMLYQNPSLALKSCSWDILKFNFKKSLDLDLRLGHWELTWTFC